MMRRPVAMLADGAATSRALASVGPDGMTTEIVTLCPVHAGWCALWRDGAGAEVRKPVCAVALVVHRLRDEEDTEPLQSVIPIVGRGDSGALELADDPGFVGVLGPGEGT